MKGFVQLVFGVLIGFALIALVAGAYIFGKKSKDKPVNITQTTENSVTPQITPTPIQNQQNEDAPTGTIEGSLSFPSEGIPENLEVCAESVQTKEKVCTTKKIKEAKYTYGVGYQLEVKAGQYMVYAINPSNPTYKAYYSESVICGLSVNCTSHKPIIVEVLADKTAGEIDPQDWYDQNQN